MNVEKIQSLIKAICMFDRNNDVARLQGGAIAAAASDKQFCVSTKTWLKLWHQWLVAYVVHHLKL